MDTIREVIARLKKLWVLSKTYDGQVADLRRAIDHVHQRVGEHTTVHGDLHLQSPSHIIAIGRYRNHDYVRIFDVDGRSFGELVDILKSVEPYGRVGKFDTLMYLPFKAVFDRDVFA